MESKINIIDNGEGWNSLIKAIDKTLDFLPKAYMLEDFEIGHWILIENIPSDHDGPALYPTYYLIIHCGNRGLRVLYVDEANDTVIVAK